MAFLVSACHWQDLIKSQAPRKSSSAGDRLPTPSLKAGDKGRVERIGEQTWLAQPQRAVKARQGLGTRRALALLVWGTKNGTFRKSQKP